MNPGLDKRMKYRVLNPALMALAAAFAVWAFVVLKGPSPVDFSSQDRKPKARKEAPGSPAPAASYYDGIVDKNIFMQARGYSPGVSAKPKKPEPQTALPVKSPPPRLALIGTVLLDDGEAAIMDYAGKASYYRLGDRVEEFTVMEIRQDEVILERETETLKVRMTPSAASPPAAVPQPGVRQMPFNPAPGSRGQNPAMPLHAPGMERAF